MHYLLVGRTIYCAVSKQNGKHIASAAAAAAAAATSFRRATVDT